MYGLSVRLIGLSFVDKISFSLRMNWRNKKKNLINAEGKAEKLKEYGVHKFNYLECSTIQ